ncbi:Sialic acid-binding Ig-like lectin 14 [Heterocephalus glaber]|nr:Sialic acid-binding Ig-like lectin 14 [Heterocephalus glaber]
MLALLLLFLLCTREWGEGGGLAGLGARLQLSVYVPTGSLQEDPGFQLRVQGSVTVQQGLCVLVPCSFSYPSRVWSSSGQLFISWFRARSHMNYDDPVATNDPDYEVQEETKGRFQLVGEVKSRDCSLNIRGARMEDEGSYAFKIDTRKIKYAYRDKKLNLQVTALTEKPIIHIAEPLESSRPTQLTCSLPGSCEGGPPLTFSWSGDALNSMDSGTLTSSVLTLTPRPQDHDTNLTCQVQLGGAQVTTERTIRLSVSSEQQWDSWPLVFMVIRGILMAAGFLLTYGLTWIYYSRSRTGSAPATRRMLALLLLALLWAGSLQQDRKFQIIVQESVTVQQGLCVLLPCSFSYPSSLWISSGEFYMSWFRIRHNPYNGDPVATNNPNYELTTEIKDRFHLLGDIRTRNCSLSIRGAKMVDSRSYVFRIETKKHDKYFYAKNPVKLQVTGR